MISKVLDFRVWRLFILEKRINALSRKLNRDYPVITIEEYWEGIEKLEALQTQYQRLKYG